MTETNDSNRFFCPICGEPSGFQEDGRCPACGAIYPLGDDSILALPEMRYQNTYVWLVLVSALDVMLTMLVLSFWESHEVNPIAAAVIDVMGFGWAIVFKFATILLVIIICEVVGRRDDRVGQALSRLAVGLNVTAVAYTFCLMFWTAPAGQS